ncbi:MAG: hydrogenase formation protein HypD, partial [Geobacteraceae bacterium GWC2_53_11]
MKFQDEFRDRALVQNMAANIRRMAEHLPAPVNFMEVCGTHTMSIYQYGIRSLLPDKVRLVSGPGCPVCVTPIGYVDKALACAAAPGTIVATFGDMLRVPGSRSSLMEQRAGGADIRIVYSPLDAVALAKNNPERRVVFLGVGFETTAPTIAVSILEAARLGLANYCVLASHKTMPVPMDILTGDPELNLKGYLCPAHVSTVIGGKAYQPLAEKYRIPCVVTGFEPADVMQGIEMLLAQILRKESKVEIQY